jgi:hypothetical protein
MANSGPNLEVVDHTLRNGKHSAFLNVYNRTVVKKESRFSRTLSGISDYKMTFLLFLILYTQVFGAAAVDDIFNVEEVSIISLKNGRPAGQAKFLGEHIFEWELGRRLIQKIIDSIGTSQKVSVCKQRVETRHNKKHIFQGKYMF